MSNNIFKTCRTDSEIMKRLFELSSSGKYSRVELLNMSNERRSELKKENNSTIVFNKIVLPETPSSSINEVARQSVIIIGDPKSSSTFEFLPDNRVKF